MKIISHEDKIVFVSENDYEETMLKRFPASGTVEVSWSKAWDAQDKTGNLEIHLAPNHSW